MSCITILTDFGYSDYYVSALKGAIFSKLPHIPIFDMCHDIRKFDIAHAAYILKNSYRYFPKGSVHIICVNAPEKNQNGRIIHFDGHYFIGHDNGLLFLVSDTDVENSVSFPLIDSNFDAIDNFVDKAVSIFNQISINQLGAIDKIPPHKLIQIKPRLTKNSIIGNVIQIDNYGNAVTNIKKEDFLTVEELFNEKYDLEIQVGSETFFSMHKTYKDVNPGECFFVFNKNCWLEAGVNHGNIHKLLGLRLYSKIKIEFKSKK